MHYCILKQNSSIFNKISVIILCVPTFRIFMVVTWDFASNCGVHSKLSSGGFLTLEVPEIKIAEFANSIDLVEVAHDEPPHSDLHCLPSSL